MLIYEKLKWLVSICSVVAITTAYGQVITADVCYGEVPSAFASDTAASGGVGPYSYQWQTSVDNLSWVAAPGINDLASYDPTLPATDTTYYRRMVIDQSCGDTALSNVIVIRALDSIALNTSVSNVNCIGGDDGAVDLSVTGGSMPYTYTWNTTDTTEQLNGLTEGAYTVTVTDANGCVRETTVAVDYTHELPVVDLGEDTGYGPSEVTLTTGATGTHVWSTGATSNELTFPLASDTTIWVVVTDANGCVNQDTINIALFLGVDNTVQTAHIKLYPNPTHDQLNIQIDEIKAEEVTLQVLDYSGQLIQTQKWQNTNNSLQTQISLGSYSQGVYFINLLIDGKPHTHTITVY